MVDRIASVSIFISGVVLVDLVLEASLGMDFCALPAAILMEMNETFIRKAKRMR